MEDLFKPFLELVDMTLYEALVAGLWEFGVCPISPLPDMSS